MVVSDLLTLRRGARGGGAWGRNSPSGGHWPAQPVAEGLRRLGSEAGLVLALWLVLVLPSEVRRKKLCWSAECGVIRVLGL